MNILCPGISAWSWMPQRPQQMLRAAARAGHRCFYVEPGSGSAMREVEPNVMVVGDLAEAQREAAAYVLYFTDPTTQVGRLRAGPVIFDAVDDFPGWEAALAEASRAADHVVCTSAGVQARLAEAGIAATLIPNACDYAHWSAAPDGPPPVEVDVLPRPLAVFIGAVAQWVDIALVAACAEAAPGAAFALVGPHLTTDYHAAKCPPNVWAFGFRPYAAIPAFAHAADVLLLPFREDVREAQAANPVKLWEYLATGRPVVSTRIPEVLPLHPLVRAASGQAFVGAVVKALDQDDGLEDARRSVAAANTWDERWRQVEVCLG